MSIQQIPPWPLYINFFETILSWPVNHLVVSAGAFHISLWPQEIKPREQEKKNKEQTNNVGLGQLKCKKGGSVTLRSHCLCRLMLKCILCEISTKPRGMLTHLDWSSLTAPFCWPLSTVPLRLPLPTAFSWFLLPTSLWPVFPCPLPITSRSRVQAFGFTPKQTKRFLLSAPPS